MMDLKKQKFFMVIMLACLGSFAVKAQRVEKLGNNSLTIVPSAVLEIESTDKGFLPPRMTSSQRDAIVSPLAGLMIYCSDCGTKGEPQFYNGAQWMSMATVSANANTITSTTGKIWMDKNLGASTLPSYPGDQYGYGSLFQWGRAAEGHELVAWNNSSSGQPYVSAITGTSSTTTVTTNPKAMLIGSANWYTGTTPAPDILWQGINGINNPCPSGYRLPTTTEFDAERIKFKTQDASGAYGALRMTTPGNRAWNDGGFFNVGVVGFYWVSTVASGSLVASMIITSSNVVFNTNNRSNSMSVRCIKD